MECLRRLLRAIRTYRTAGWIEEAPDWMLRDLGVDPVEREKLKIERGDSPSEALRDRLLRFR